MSKSTSGGMLRANSLQPVRRDQARVWRYFAGLYVRPYRLLLVSIAVSLGESLLLGIIALLFRTAFDELIPAGLVRPLVLAGLGAVLLYIGDAGITLWMRRWVLHASKLAIGRLRGELLDRLFSFSRSYYSETDRSRLHTVIVQDTERLDTAANALLGVLIPGMVIGAALSLVLLYINWALFLLMICSLLPFALINRGIARRYRSQVHQAHDSFESFSRGVSFVLQMMDLTRIQSAERFESERQAGHVEDLRVASTQMSWLRELYGASQNTVIAISTIVILIAGGALVAAGHITLGELLSFYAAAVLLRTHLRAVSLSLTQVIEGQESLTTLFDLLFADDAQPYGGTRILAFDGGISLQSVSFSYNSKPVLYDIDFRIAAHSTVAIVGPNGAGKSTIASLMLGLYRPDKGQVCADQHPLSELDISHLRSQISSVMQDPLIFPGTIAENISYGRPEASQRQIIEASELGTAHEFIQQLAHGYDTSVGQSGVLLSGGQRQRIALARALLRQPKLLILGEPTNHLDEAAIRRLIANLNSLPYRPTIVLIGHDMAMASQADDVLVLREGRIVAQGHPTAPCLQAVLQSGAED